MKRVRELLDGLDVELDGSVHTGQDLSHRLQSLKQVIEERLEQLLKSN